MVPHPPIGAAGGGDWFPQQRTHRVLFLEHESDRQRLRARGERRQLLLATEPGRSSPWSPVRDRGCRRHRTAPAPAGGCIGDDRESYGLPRGRCRNRQALQRTSWDPRCRQRRARCSRRARRLLAHPVRGAPGTPGCSRPRRRHGASPSRPAKTRAPQDDGDGLVASARSQPSPGRAEAAQQAAAQGPGGQHPAVTDAAPGVDDEHREILFERRILESVIHDDDAGAGSDCKSRARDAVTRDDGGCPAREQKRLVADLRRAVPRRIDLRGPAAVPP